MANIIGNNLKNRLNGTSGNDIFAGRGGDDTINGGLGTDTSYYSGNVAGYQFSTVGGQLLVRDTVTTDGDDGADTLIDIEKLAFSNAVISVSSGQQRVNNASNAETLNPDVAILSGGEQAIVWYEQLGNSYNIVGKVFDSYGNVLKDDFLISTQSNNLVNNDPTITHLSDGGFVVAWYSYNLSTDNGDIVFQRFDAMGNAVGAQTVANTFANFSKSQPEIKSHPNGGFILTWTSYGQDGNNDGIRYRIYDADGNPNKNVDLPANTIPNGEQTGSDVAVLADGSAVIAFESSVNDESFGGIVARIINNSFTSEFRVNTSTSRLQIEPSVVALDNGGFMVVWSSNHVDSSIFVIYGQLFDSTGSPVGGEFQINTFDNVTAFNPKITNLSNGDLVVVFDTNKGVHAQRLDQAGNFLGAEIVVNNIAGLPADNASVAATTDGGFIVTWNGYSTAPTGYAIFSQRFDATGTAVGIKVTGSSSGDVLNVGNQTYLSIDGAEGNDSITGGAGDDNLIGGADKDTLIGGLGDDRLDGGSGVDSMSGGQGSDIYVVDSTTDVVTENGTTGSDTVEASITYTLGTSLEDLTLTGTANINGTGNAQGNVMIGNAGNNLIDGKAGADFMAGGLGNDTYVVDNSFDLVAENLNAGTDEVQSSVNYTLGDNIENLTLTGALAINGLGNALNNKISGNAGNNDLFGYDGKDNLRGEAGNDRLSGGNGNDLLVGGLGLDSLSGGFGNDTFRFETAAGANNRDVLLDFTSGEDIINLKDTFFGGAGNAGILSETEFLITELAPDAKASEHIIYRLSTGELFYNADGTGTGAAVLFAVLTGSLTLQYSDFEIV